MSDNEKKLMTENENLKKEISFLKEKIEKYRRMEVELSTTIDFLKTGIIK